MKILIDNGHGITTPGKCSPGNPPAIREYKYCREVADLIVRRLRTEGYDAELVTPEDADVTIGQRVARANAWCDTLGAKNVLLISVHLNAAGGDGKWHTASGWSGWVAPNASERSKRLAQLLFAEAEKRGLKGNRAVPAGKYWVGDFGIVRSTKCPGVLTENMFQDCREDVELLLSPEGRDRIVALHVDAIAKYVKTYGR